MTKGPIESPRPASRNVPLTPASLKVAICSGERVTPAGGPAKVSSDIRSIV
jgi:hypothetical protein